MTTAMKAKAERLVNEGRVYDLPDAKVRVVEGDDGIYLVMMDNGAATIRLSSSSPTLSSCIM